MKTVDYKRRAIIHFVIAMLCLPLLFLVPSGGPVQFLATVGMFCALMFTWYAWQWIKEVTDDGQH